MNRENFEKYKPKDWSYSAGKAIQRVWRVMCNETKLVTKEGRELCSGLKLVAHDVIYPLNGWGPAYSTNKTVIEETVKKLTYEVVSIHLWTDATWNEKILKSGPPNVYSILAQEFCPNVYGLKDPYFD